MQTVSEVLKKIAEYSISNRADFEALVKKSLDVQQTDRTKKQQKRVPQITTRLEQIEKILDKLYEDNALGAIEQDRYEQMSRKYSEELTERYADFAELTPAILNEFISRIEVHERDQKRARYAIQHIGIDFNHIGKFENELTQLAEPTEQEIRQMREEIEEAKREKSRAYHREYSREYRARNLEKQREYDRIKAREYRARKKAQTAATAQGAETAAQGNTPPAAFFDRAILWNEVEKIEKAKNAQLAREIEIALPRELTREQSISLVREYVKRHFVAAGMCADFAIHDTDGGNPHVHIMLTMRPFDEGGEWGAKQKKEYILDKDGNKIYDPKKRQYKCKSIPATDWNEQIKAEEWRAAWAQLCNQCLEQNGHAERVDHRSYERQGIDQIPTVHLGVAASAMEKRGIRTERGDLNREIEVTNQKLRQLKARISKLQNWLKEETENTENTEPPTLADYIQGILSRRAQAGKSGHSQSLYNLKDAAKMLNFLQANNIMDMTGLDEKFKTMIGEQLDIQGKLKPVERRLATLKKHIEQADIYCLYNGVCQSNEVEILAGHVGSDYIHLLVSVPPHLSASKLVQYIKGNASRKLQMEYKELNKQFWGQHLWARGYFVASSGNVTDEIIKAYIQNQDLQEKSNSDNFEIG